MICKASFNPEEKNSCLDNLFVTPWLMVFIVRMCLIESFFSLFLFSGFFFFLAQILELKYKKIKFIDWDERFENYKDRKVERCTSK